MSHPLSRIPLLCKFVDERFLEHRRRSTSLMGIAGVLVAGIIFEFRLIFNHVIDWELFAIVLIMGTVKLAAMIWYRIHD